MLEFIECRNPLLVTLKYGKLWNLDYIFLSLSQGELAALESQGRIAKLSSDDLQAKLMQAFAENEELVKKLKEAEDALRDKVCTPAV